MTDRAPHYAPRYWVRRGDGAGAATSRFADADGPLARVHERHAPLEALAEVPCLVLLGEAGLGKSTELKRERERLSGGGVGAGVRLVQLATVGSSADLSRYLAEADARLSMPGGDYHLLLDALDEARLDAYALGAALGDELMALGPMKRDRLRLRLTCRTAVWPAFTELLGNLWTVWSRPGQVEIRDLSDLAADDVEAIVRAELDERAPAFLAELQSTPSASAFSTNPQRLALLLSLSPAGVLPGSERELYERGCHRLCEVLPKDPSRTLTAGQRLAVAGRIAAMTLLTEGGSPPTDDELVGGWEPLWLPDGSTGEGVDVTREALEEVRRTPLFGADGGFVHRAFAEYLAARRLAQLPRPLDALAVLRPRVGSEAGVVPHLRGLAAWFATLSRPVREALVDSEPDLLLMSDLSDAGDGFRVRLVDALLDHAARGRFAPWGLAWERGAMLAFPGIAEHLWATISNVSASERVREVALELATATASAELIGRLVTLALDRSAPVRLRHRAIRAIARHGSSADKLRLLPLAERPVDDPDDSDADDELKGEALRALWPGLIDDETLLACLSPPRRETLWGAYAGFVHGTLLRRLDRLALPLGLAWLRERRDWGARWYSPWRAVEAAMLEAAWRRWREPKVLEQLAQLVWSATRAYRDLRKEFAPGGWTSEHTEPRRAVVGAVLALLSFDAAPPSEVGKLWQWVTSEDSGWVMAQLRAAGSEADERQWATLARNAFVCDSPDARERFLEACDSSPIMREVFRDCLGPIALDSAEAEVMRRQHQTLTDWRARMKERERELAEEEREERERPIREIRERRAAEGGTVAWLVAARSASYGAMDVRSAPWWLAADGPTRAEVCDLAAAYLAAPPAERAWHGTDSVPLPEVAGWLALMLLGTERPLALEELSNAALTRWAGILLVWWDVPERDVPCHDALLRRVALAAPAELLRRLETELCDGKPGAPHPTLIERLPLIWTPELATALRAWVTAGRVNGDDAESILTTLLGRGDASDLSWAFGLIEGDALPAELRVAAAAALVDRDPPAHWTRVWAAMTVGDELGLALIEHIMGGVREIMKPTLRHRLTEAQLADTYLWLHRHRTAQPRSQSLRGLRPTSDIDWIDEWKSDLLTGLRERGTQAAIDALVGLRAELPELDWLDWTVAEARARVRAASWRPLTAAEARALLDTKLTLWVRDADVLFDRVLRALERYQRRLHEHSPDWKALWRTPGEQPAVENDCTEVVKQRLIDDLTGATAGFAAVLEERFLASWAQKTGKEPDLVLRATTHEGESVAVVFEAKRDSHGDVLTALDTQLADRYLSDPTYQHGIYLVYWFGQGGTRLPPDLSAARELLREQATAASRRTGRRIEAVILDVRGPA